MTGFAGTLAGLEGELCSFGAFWSFWGVLRIPASVELTIEVFWLALSLSSIRTVEFEDEDEVSASRTAASPLGSVINASGSLEMLPALLRVTGGLESAGLPCLSFAAGNRMGAIRPGDCEDIEVGVVSRLYGPGPGDSDHLVDGLALKTLSWL